MRKINIIKVFCDRNMENSIDFIDRTIHAPIIVPSHIDSLTIEDIEAFLEVPPLKDKIVNNKDFLYSDSLQDIFLEHRKHFRDSLKEIEGNTFILKDVSERTEQFFNANIDSLVVISDRADYLRKTFPILEKYSIYNQELDLAKKFDIIKRVSFNTELEFKKFEEFSGISTIIQKLPTDNECLFALKNYFLDNRDNVVFILKESKKYIQDISSSPNYMELVNGITCMFDSLNDLEISTLLKFIDTFPELSFVSLNPSMVFILGNVLFVEYLLPLIKSSTIYGPFYNWTHLVKDAAPQILHRKKSIKFYREKQAFFINHKYTATSIGGSLSLGVLFFVKALYQATTPVIEVLPKRTLREVVDNIPKSKGLEIFGFELKKVVLIVSSLGTELGRIVGGFTTGLFQGYMDKARPIVETVADFFDKKNGQK